MYEYLLEGLYDKPRGQENAIKYIEIARDESGKIVYSNEKTVLLRWTRTFDNITSTDGYYRVDLYSYTTKTPL